MKGNGWVVVAKVAGSVAAQRTDSSGDMEQLELMELILLSEQRTRTEAERDAAARRAAKDGWIYTVMTRRDYEAAIGTLRPAAGSKPKSPGPASTRPKAA